MRLAQQLYEGVELDGETVGLITYMRTDGVQMAREAVDGDPRPREGARTAATTCPARRANTRARSRTRRKRTRRSARPTSRARPAEVARYLSPDQRRLYELVWKRAVASQMQSAELDQVSVDVDRRQGPDAARHRLHRRVRRLPEAVSRGHDGRAPAEEDESRMLPPMAERDPLRRGEVAAHPAFHPAAAALFRSQPGEEDGGARHRPAVHLRLDPLGAAGPQLCAAGQAAVHPGGSRPAGDRVPGQLLRALRRHRLHRLDGGKARRHLRRPARLARGDARLLGRVLPAPSSRPRTSRSAT